jgi:PKHD-type hydroxylase
MNAWWQLWPRFFSPDECQRIVAKGLGLPEATGTIGHGRANRKDENFRRSKLRWFDRNARDMQWLYDKMEYLFHRSNHSAFGFDISYFHELQVTEYSADYEGKYDWHEDTFWILDRKACMHRKLSMVVQLTDPAQYEGGDLELKQQPPEPHKLRTLGSVIVFPSVLQHRVTPVTKGVRYSLVSWIEGPPFR